MKYLHILLLSAAIFSHTPQAVMAKESMWSNVKSDYDEFYSSDRFIRMGIIFAGGAVLANSDTDQNFQNDYQSNTRSKATDEFSADAKVLGEGKYLIPLSLISAGIGNWLNDGTELTGVAKWGERTARAYFVGGPAVLATQVLTGASRPSEDKGISDWKPFNDNNGVSGHSFVGAVPFITVAYMNDNKFIKYSAYLASTLAGYSRINDNQHYLSQSILGWYLAWESVDSVYTVDANKSNNLKVQPLVGSDSYGIGLSYRW